MRIFILYCVCYCIDNMSNEHIKPQKKVFAQMTKRQKKTI